LKLGEVSAGELRHRLSLDGLTLAMPPFVVRIRSDVASLADDLALMYGEFALHAADDFCDFHVEVMHARGLRRWFKPLAEFSSDGARSFVPLPAQQCYTMLEWGLNWCVAAHAHQYLLIHAAVIERGGQAVILPAPPGSGKSTLCAGLVHRGWRLLSDELALLDMDSGLVHGMARPVNLKNGSIAAIRDFVPEAILTAPVPNTNKGTVALMQAPADAARRVREPAAPAWIVLPSYRAGAAAELQPMEKAESFMAIAEQSFNYDVHGALGFQALGRLVDRCATYRFEYSSLAEAAAIFDGLGA